MDVNGTRFHLVLGQGDWLPQPASCPDGDGNARPCARWDAPTASMSLAPLPAVFPPRRAEAPPKPEDRRGAGRDRHGNWYWVAEDGRSILSRSPRDGAPVPFWPHASAEPVPPPPAQGDFGPVDPPPAPQPPRLGGLAVTTEHYLVAGNLDDRGLLVFDLAAGGPPVALRWPANVPFSADDVGAAYDGGVWILDRAYARLWSLDRVFRVREASPSPVLWTEPDFLPKGPWTDDVDGDEERDRSIPLTIDAALDVSSVLDPVSVEALPDGSALVLGRDGFGSDSAPVIHHYALADGERGAYPLRAALDGYGEVIGEMPRGHDFAFAATAGAAEGTIDGRVYVVAPDGNQAFAFVVKRMGDELRVEFETAFHPMRRHEGRALVSAGGEAHYDSGDRWVPLLEYPRPRFAREAVLTLPVRGFAQTGEAPVNAFDGREPGCVWHRLFLDGCIPPESSVSIESRAADTLDALAVLEWSPEPTPYLRAAGPELPFAATFDSDDAHAGTWETLFQNAVGRYLQLRVTLRGNGRITPRVRGLRAYYPRFSYLREYLPAVWREDAGSAWFVDRFLSNVEGSLTEIEGRIAGAQALFAPATVPAEFLDWLAGWMGAALDASWSEEKKRFFLAHAMQMFAGRGTRAGLIRALRLALEPCVDPTLFDEVEETASATSGDCGCGCGGSSSGSIRTVAAAGSQKGTTSGGSGASSGSSGGCGCGGSASAASYASARPAESSRSASSGSSGSAGSTAIVRSTEAASGSTASTQRKSAAARFSVRVVEQFLTRGVAGVAYGDVAALAGPGTTTTALAWTPAQGPEPLHARWREWLSVQYADIQTLRDAWSAPNAPAPPYASFDDARLRLPSIAPSGSGQAADWRRFLREGLGFTWIVPDAAGDRTLWSDFLASRHRHPADLSRAWALPAGQAYASFDAVPYPQTLPENGAALADWIAFVSVVVPMRRGAHRFTVLVPVAAGDNRETQRQKRELARRIALLEKPAHTVVETRLYWAAFRVGEARLGTDTLLGRGSRFTALVLDRGELGASTLDWTEPWNVRGRMVVGRDPVATRASLTGTSQRWT